MYLSSGLLGPYFPRRHTKVIVSSKSVARPAVPELNMFLHPSFLDSPKVTTYLLNANWILNYHEISWAVAIKPGAHQQDSMLLYNVPVKLEAMHHWLMPNLYVANFGLFCEKICHQFRETNTPGDFLTYQILPNLTKLQRRRRPASKQDKFLSSVRTDRYLN